MNQRRQSKPRLMVLAVSLLATVSMAGAAILLVRTTGQARSAGPPASAATAPNPRASASAPKRQIPFEDAKPILAALSDARPAALSPDKAGDLAASWPGWVSQHDADIRARLARGDEDSIVHLWLYGTTFTRQPRALLQEIAAHAGANAEDVLFARLDDFIGALSLPGANERLRFARQVLARHRIDPTTPGGAEQARRFLIDARERVLADSERYGRAAESARRLENWRTASTVFATLYQDRGLSSDTSMLVDFSVEQALAAASAAGLIGPGAVQRSAIVGPGLDFTDKAAGYDFYPQQTIQPFALLDSLARLGLAARGGTSVATFDVSDRVNQHLEAARQRANRGEGYVVQLPLEHDSRRHIWRPDLIHYWDAFGDRIGDVAAAIPAPPSAGPVRLRAVRVRPAVVASVTPYDLNIVTDRLAPLAADERFDLVVATNVLVYYDRFEQALALANIAKMLRPGGLLLTNYMVAATPPMEALPDRTTWVSWDERRNGDTMFFFRRR